MPRRVSVIIPVYNKGDVIAQTLETVRAQTYLEWECILVDDGSTDNSQAVILQFVEADDRFRYFKRPDKLPKGGNACRNYGFEKSNGDFVQWFDADDLMYENKLAEKAQMLIETSFDFVVSEGIAFKNIDIDSGFPWNQIYSDSPLIDHALGKIHYHTNGPMFRRKFLEDKKHFDVRLKRKQEWEFYTRLLSFSPKVGLISKPLYAYRIHANSINGRDSMTTLSSRIFADILVFKLLNQKRAQFPERMAEIRKHFIHKAMLKFRIAKNDRHISNMIYSMFAVCLFLKVSLLFDIFVNKLNQGN